MSSTENQSRDATDPSLWVEKYGDYLYRYALARLRNSQEAENVVQETFLAALKAHDSFSGRSTERTWMTGILKHKIIDQVRFGFKNKVVSDLQNEEKAVNDFFDENQHLKTMPQAWSSNPHEELQNSEFWTTFHKCLDKLPENTARVFSMREFDKIDSKIICKELGITSTNLWVMLHRARLHLRECLDKNWFGHEKHN